MADFDEHWNALDAWTAREFALLCCSLNPEGVDIFPDHNMEAYHKVRENISRAVQVRAVPTIDNLAWPGTSEERMRDAIPAFRPADVASWASKHYPGRFPWLTNDRNGEQVDSRERTTLLIMIAALLKEADLDATKAVEVIAAHTRELNAPVSTRAIRTHLKRIPAALENKTAIATKV